MSLYEQLPEDFLLEFYFEINRNIAKGILSKNMYYELGLIIAAAEKRGIHLDEPTDFREIVNQKVFSKLAI